MTAAARLANIISRTGITFRKSGLLSEVASRAA